MSTLKAKMPKRSPRYEKSRRAGPGIARDGSSSAALILPGDSRAASRKWLDIDSKRRCECGPTHINCMTPKEWMKSQLGMRQFFYEKRDIRDKFLHPATYPIALAFNVH